MDGNINPNDRREETSAMATSKTPKATCRNCGRRRPIEETFQANRVGGGTWRRPSRTYQSTICRECAEEVISKTDEKRRIYAGWAYYSVRRGIEAIYAKAEVAQ